MHRMIFETVGSIEYSDNLYSSNEGVIFTKFSSQDFKNLSSKKILNKWLSDAFIYWAVFAFKHCWKNTVCV